MPTHGYSTLVFGTELECKKTDTIVTYTRFDPKTGSPIEKQDEGFDLELSFNGTTITLPPDNQYFKDLHQDHGFLNSTFNRWVRERTYDRISNWMQFIGFPDSSTKCRWFQEDSFQKIIIGQELAHGSGDDARLVKVDRKSINEDHFHSYLEDKFAFVFPGVKFELNLFLYTSEG